MKINNLPKYAENYKYIVARRVENELWFYAGFNDVNQAIICSNEIVGEVFATDDECSECEVNV